MKGKRIILFDLGDTLIYRQKSHYEYDICLLMEFLGLERRRIEEAMKESLSKYKGVYDTFTRGEAFTNLEKEDRFTQDFFLKVLRFLCTEQSLDEFFEKRRSEKRYKLFNGAKKLLSSLNKLYNLGIFTNGRPSRRRVLENLYIDEYFKKNLIFISDEIGLSKPDKKAFLYVENKINTKDLIYIDDELENIKVARELNWNTVLVNRGGKKFRSLYKLLNKMEYR